MKTISKISKLGLIALAIIVMSSCSNGNTAELQNKVDELQAIVDANIAERELTKTQLATFDELDLEAYNNRDDKRFAEIHHENCRVIMPDGNVIEETATHTKDMHFLYNILDSKVTGHPVAFGFGEWTAGISATKGKWVNPITLPDGRKVEPTGKEYTMSVCTLARWENGRIVEEYLFWDNAHLYRSIGFDIKNAK